MVIKFARVKVASLKFRGFCQFAKNMTIKTRENQYEYGVQMGKSVFNFFDLNLVRTLIFS